MGTQFGWFYDVIAVAVLLVCLYLFGKKGIFKSVVAIIGCIVGIVIAVPVSQAVSESVYKTAVRDSNIKKTEKSLIDIEISSYLGDSLENMEYGVFVKRDKIENILDSEKDLDEQLYNYLNSINGKVVDKEEVFYENLNKAYAEVMKQLISGDFSKYAVETASQKIIDGKADFGNLLKMIKTGEQRREVAEIIADDYIAEAYMDIIRLLVCVILFAVIFIIGLMTSKSLSGSQREINESTGSHVAGGICGLFIGVAVVFIVAVAVRLYVVMGSNEMLFFNNDAIDKTYIFRYAYDIACKM